MTHDMLSGPCECGAWHNPLEKEWEHMNPEQNVYPKGPHPNISKETARTFTDDDLKRLKEHIGGWYFDNDFLSRLLARLEAAELALMTECTCDPTIHPTVCKETVAWNNWRKAAGK